MWRDMWRNIGRDIWRETCEKIIGKMNAFAFFDERGGCFCFFGTKNHSSSLLAPFFIKKGENALLFARGERRRRLGFGRERKEEEKTQRKRDIRSKLKKKRKTRGFLDLLVLNSQRLLRTSRSKKPHREKTIFDCFFAGRAEERDL